MTAWPNNETPLQLSGSVKEKPASLSS